MKLDTVVTDTDIVKRKR